MLWVLLGRVHLRKHSRNKFASETSPPKFDVYLVCAWIRVLADAINKPNLQVAVISVMGMYRTGKSFLLDLLMRYLRASGRPGREGRGGRGAGEGGTPPPRGRPGVFGFPPGLEARLLSSIIDSCHRYDA